jgi:hypothetical protein
MSFVMRQTPPSLMPGQKARSAVFAPRGPGIQKTRVHEQVFLDCRVKPGNEGN